MKNVYTWAAKPAKRSTTVGDLKAAKGKKKFTQVRANTFDEAFAAEEAGIDMIVANARNIVEVRKGSNKLFLTASLFWEEFDTKEEILKGAFKALENGADAIFTPRNTEIVEMLSNEDIPVMGHLGLLPQTAKGKFKSKGKNEVEKRKLLKDAQDLEQSGAFGIVLECIYSDISKQITNSINIPTIGIGASVNCDGQVLVTDDLIGLNETNFRFVKKFGNVKKYIKSAVIKYKNSVKQKKFPSKKNSY